MVLSIQYTSLPTKTPHVQCWLKLCQQKAWCSPQTITHLYSGQNSNQHSYRAGTSLQHHQHNQHRHTTMKLFLLSAAALLAIANGATLRGSEQNTNTKVSGAHALLIIICIVSIVIVV